MSVITTNSIVDGDIRKDGLAQIVAASGQINMAVRGIKWSGAANLVVSLLAVHKGAWSDQRMLDNQPAGWINSFFEADEELAKPHNLVINSNKMFTGSYFLGDGFLLSHDEARELRKAKNEDENKINTEVIMPIINGQELNNEPDQAPGRSIINFYDWPLDEVKKYEAPFKIVEDNVKPYRADKKVKSHRELWWVYANHRPSLTNAIRDLQKCFVTARTTKHLSFSLMPTNLCL